MNRLTGAGIGICAVLLYFAGCYSERVRWEARLVNVQRALAKSDSTLWRLRADSARLSAQFKIDTIEVAKWHTKWREIERLVASPAETLTVERVVQVASEVIKRDTVALNSCKLQLSNCENRAAALGRANANLEKMLARPKPVVTLERVAIIGLVAALALKVL